MYNKLPTRKCDTFIIYSDGCTYQNHNVVKANAKKHNKTVIQKILERGHAQMEVDSVHSLIEQRVKNAKIYCPADYVEIIQEARQTTKPYTIKYVQHNFFKDFSNIGELKSIRPGRAVGDPTVTDLRCLKYHPGKEDYVE